MNATAAAEGWDATTVSVDSRTETGTTIRLHGVRAEKNKATGRIVIDPDEIMRAQFRDIATQIGVTELRDIATLTILNAPVGNLPAKYVVMQYSMNKMLFYQWAYLDKDGLGEAFPHDEFIAERKGPVPKNLTDDLRRLEREGLVTVKWPSGPTHVPAVIALTDKGKMTADAITGKTDPWFRHETNTAKGIVFPLSAEKLKDKVHSEFPAYRRKYVEVDDS